MAGRIRTDPELPRLGGTGKMMAETTPCRPYVRWGGLREAAGVGPCLAVNNGRGELNGSA